MNNYCRLANSCAGECPSDMCCPLDGDYSSQKDRSKSRHRHLNKQKAQKSAEKALSIIKAKTHKNNEDDDPNRRRILCKKYSYTIRKIHSESSDEAKEVDEAEGTEDTVGAAEA